MQVISLEDVCKTYFMGDNQVHALRNVSFSIEEGEFVVIIGQSGAGKSTVLNILGGIDYPSSGQVLIDNQDITDFLFTLYFICKSSN